MEKQGCLADSCSNTARITTLTVVALSRTRLPAGPLRNGANSQTVVADWFGGLPQVSTTKATKTTRTTQTIWSANITPTAWTTVYTMSNQDNLADQDWQDCLDYQVH